MKERPILFSAPMVRAILEGRKTQTRRALKPGLHVTAGGAVLKFRTGPNDIKPVYCPYGEGGDRLWVKETHSFEVGHPSGTGAQVWYRADQSDADIAEEKEVRRLAPQLAREHRETRWRPSIHMPRWASRINLEVVATRVERLQGISEADAVAEGVEALDSDAPENRDGDDFDHALCRNCGGLRLYVSVGANGGARFDTDCGFCDTHAKRYQWLWEAINGEESGAKNPWVWVVEFKRLML